MPPPREPLVTIGIPAYNRAAGLRRTLEAITTQRYRNLEIVVSDNCSPDPAIRDLALGMAAADPRITYHRQESNIGAVGNFFALVALARGDYFMWAADDDWWDPEFVGASLELLEADPSASVALTRFEPLPDPEGRVRLLPRAFEKIREFSHPDLCRRLRRYLAQKDAFGKAHIAYGLFPTPAIRQAVATVERVVSPVMPLADFERVDVLLNGVLLTLGNLVTSDRCLRRFSFGPRKGVGAGTRPLAGVDPNFMRCLEFFLPVIDGLDLPESGKAGLRAAVRRRKFGYLMERVGRKLLVYKLYWSLYKKLRYRRYR